MKPKVTVNLSKIILLGSKNEGEGESVGSSKASQPQQKQIKSGSGSMKDSLDDEIPF